MSKDEATPRRFHRPLGFTPQIAVNLANDVCAGLVKR
ncbi:MAG: hypothetical protein UU15_C0002G0007 [Candidatus Levybacteria bacterium GW2011_GWC2_40_7]|nr:MAG: hypothetical protein UU15_C0002G0007 [Candidatus Levybacteria bacterium GW2011_GWC2_40_7]